jgi:glycosyltransferase involved in cell wall biosynthesis
MHLVRGNIAKTISAAEAIGLRREKRAHFMEWDTYPTVSLIIPAKNEARNLPWVLTRIPSIITEVILVDGNSTDDTVDVAKNFYPNIIVLPQLANGKGSALATGMLAATGDIVVMIDADCSMDPQEIHGLVGALLSGLDVVKASRYIAGGGSDDISYLRHFGNQGLRLVSKFLFRHNWSELAYGYAAFWRDVIPALNLESIIASGNSSSKKEYGRGFEIENLLFTRSHKIGLKVGEVFSFEYPRQYGTSNLSTFKDGWRVLMSIFHEFFRKPIPHPEGTHQPVIFVGPGSKFLSGVSQYTMHAVNALSKIEDTGVILLRNLIPRFLYPGRRRVGAPISTIKYNNNVAVYDGVDWQGGKSLRGAERFLSTVHPRIVVLQWWTSAVVNTYFSIARKALKSGAKIIIEFHEIQDVGEAKLPLAKKINNLSLNYLLKKSSGFIAHSTHDADIIRNSYPAAANMPYEVIVHGPFNSLVEVKDVAPERKKVKDSEPIKLLFFGVIREYKGVDVLLEAYRKLCMSDAKVELTIVGEPWGNDAKKMVEEISKGQWGSIKLIDRYVEDAEIPYLIADNDVLILPYKRSSASGPLALAMAAGVPVITTSIKSLEEATEGYSGAVHVPVNDSDAIAKAIIESRKLVGIKHNNPLSWDNIAVKYFKFFEKLTGASK